MRTNNPRTKLIRLRKEKKLTQEQLAKLLNKKRTTYSNYENGYRNPDLKTIIELKRILGVSDDTFFLKDNDTLSV